MTKTEGLSISDAIHKATIEVDEEGTIATAVTMMTMKSVVPTSCEPPRPLRITVNKPFLFFIRSGNYVVIAGRIVDPRK